MLNAFTYVFPCPELVNFLFQNLFHCFLYILFFCSIVHLFIVFPILVSFLFFYYYITSNIHMITIRYAIFFHSWLQYCLSFPTFIINSFIYVYSFWYNSIIWFTYLEVNIIWITLGTNRIPTTKNKIQLWLVNGIFRVLAEPEFVFLLDIAAILSPEMKQKQKKNVRNIPIN